MAAETIAGRYVLCDPIGSGGSGTVWRAFDRQRQRYCAAKLLRQRDAGELLRFAREQSVRLEHPHIVSPYAWAADDDMVLIVSELMDGGSLQVLLGDYGALSEPTVVEILDQVLSALEAVHTAELIHRDVKPGNLLLRATGIGPLQVMLADFGLTISQRDARLTATGMVIGTPGYLPPEVLVGRVSPEPAHDMYAVGRLALALLVGHEVAAADQNDVPITDRCLREVVHGLLLADPARRPPSALVARTMLRGADRSATPWTGDGDPITVLDQLPPLPDGWGVAGEIADPSTSQPVAAKSDRATLVESAHPAPLPSPPVLEHQVTAPTRDRDSAAALGRPTAGPDPSISVALTAPIRSVGSAAAGVRPASARRRGRSRRAVVGAVIGLLLVVTVGVVFARSIGTDPGVVTEPPNSSVNTPSASAPVTVSATTVALTVPATTVADLRAGDTCGWQLEGDRRTTSDGELVCTVDAGAYRWVVAPG